MGASALGERCSGQRRHGREHGRAQFATDLFQRRHRRLGRLGWGIGFLEHHDEGGGEDLDRRAPVGAEPPRPALRRSLGPRPSLFASSPSARGHRRPGGPLETGCGRRGAASPPPTGTTPDYPVVTPDPRPHAAFGVPLGPCRAMSRGWTVTRRSRSWQRSATPTALPGADRIAVGVAIELPLQRSARPAARGPPHGRYPRLVSRPAAVHLSAVEQGGSRPSSSPPSKIPGCPAPRPGRAFRSAPERRGGHRVPRHMGVTGVAGVGPLRRHDPERDRRRVWSHRTARSRDSGSCLTPWLRRLHDTFGIRLSYLSDTA